jgi:hypothetical protein
MHNKMIFFSLALGIAQTNFPCEKASTTPANNQQLTQLKHVAFHFDINKTILATDKVQGKDLVKTVNEVIAEYTHEKWNGIHAQSYYHYISDQIEQEHPDLPRASDDFRHMRLERIGRFSNYLQERDPQLLARYEIEKAKMLQILSGDETVIFPSFYKALRWLQEQFPERHTIFLRTFGKDLPEIVPLIEEKTHIRFAGHGEFKGTDLHTKDGTESIMNFFTRPAGQHYAIRDDYAHWKSKGFQAAGGKLFPIDLNNTDFVSMFFDDNADDEHRPIIRPVGPNGELHNTTILLEAGHIVAVNTKEAILDEDYFINKIKDHLAKLN